MRIIKSLLLSAVTICCPLLAGAEASGTIVDGNRRYTIKEAGCFIHPKKGDVDILLFERALTPDEQSEALAWTGDSTFHFPSVGSIRVNFGMKGLPRVLSLDDPNVSFVHLGNHMLFVPDIRGAFKEWAVTPKGCQATLQFKGKDSNVPLEYQLQIRAPVILPQPPQAPPADLMKAAKAFEAAESTAKSPEELASFYTSSYLEVLARRKPATAREAEVAKAFEKVGETMKADFRKAKKNNYRIIPRPNSVVLISTGDLGSGVTVSSRRVYVQENGEWKILLER